MTPRSPDRPLPDGPSFHVGWTLTVGLICAAVIALTTATQIHLTMWDHGHTFARIFAWHFSMWVPWALLAPWVMNMGARIAASRWTVLLAVRVAGLGLLLTLASLLGATGMMVWL